MISSRKIISVFIIFFLSAIFFAPDFTINVMTLFIVAFCCAIASILFRKKRYFIIPLFMFAAISGLLYFNLIKSESDGPRYIDNKEYKLEGYISSYPNKKEKSTAFVFKEKSGANIYVSARNLEEFEYGEKITVTGKVENVQNEDEFNFRDYFSTKGIYYQIFYPKIERTGGFAGNNITRFLYASRKEFEDKTQQIFVKPFSSLVLGLLLGIKSISSDLMNDFSKVSLSHIIVVSGYNLSIIAGAFSGIFSHISRRLSFWFPLFGIISFTFLVGAEAPVLRAGIMASVILFGKKKGRKTDSISILLVAALIMSLLNPGLLRFDPGFQLSFLSTFGILLFADRIQHYFSIKKFPTVLSETIAATLSAQLFIVPVVSYYFGRISLIGPLANFVVLPFVPLIMLLSFIVICIGFISVKLAIFLSMVPVLFLFIMIKLTQTFSSIAFSSIPFGMTWIGIAIYFCVIFMILIKRGRVEEKTL